MDFFHFLVIAKIKCKDWCEKQNNGKKSHELGKENDSCLLRNEMGDTSFKTRLKIH